MIKDSVFFLIGKLYKKTKQVVSSALLSSSGKNKLTTPLDGKMEIWLSENQVTELLTVNGKESAIVFTSNEAIELLPMMALFKWGDCKYGTLGIDLNIPEPYQATKPFELYSADYFNELNHRIKPFIYNLALYLNLRSFDKLTEDITVIVDNVFIGEFIGMKCGTESTLLGIKFSPDGNVVSLANYSRLPNGPFNCLDKVFTKEFIEKLKV